MIVICQFHMSILSIFAVIFLSMSSVRIEISSGEIFFNQWLVNIFVCNNAFSLNSILSGFF